MDPDGAFPEQRTIEPDLGVPKREHRRDGRSKIGAVKLARIDPAVGAHERDEPPAVAVEGEDGDAGPRKIVLARR